MNTLDLSSPNDGGGGGGHRATLGPLSFWFWLKAGVGFSVGAAITYVASQIVWGLTLYAFPQLFILRLFTRF